MRLDGAAAIVTGGSSGIGAATVELLCDAGARVAVLDVNEPSGPDVAWARCDIASEDEVIAAVAQAHRTLGALDASVLCAGVGGFGALVDLSSAEWDRVMGVNLRGTFLCLREAGRLMVAGGRGGAIVAVTSVSGFLADRRMGHYSASKAGVAELVRVAARELGPHGITVNAVAPGPTETELFRANNAPGSEGEKRYLSGVPMRRFGKPHEIAAAIEFLLSEDAGFITGQTLFVDGGSSIGKAAL